MEQIKKYEIEGMELNIPLRYDEQSDKYIEDYRECIENSLYTPKGHPIMFAGEDACTFAEEETPGGCPDCGSCKFYRRADEHSWIGTCVNKYRKRR